MLIASDRVERERGCGRRDVKVGAGPDRGRKHPEGLAQAAYRDRGLSAAAESAFHEGVNRLPLFVTSFPCLVGRSEVTEARTSLASGLF